MEVKGWTRNNALRIIKMSSVSRADPFLLGCVFRQESKTVFGM